MFLKGVGLIYRPADQSGRRIPPEEFYPYRANHLFQFPRCFCAANSEVNGVHNETTIYIASSGGYRGEYVARCSHLACGYLGELMSFDGFI